MGSLAEPSYSAEDFDDDEDGGDLEIRESFSVRPSFQRVPLDPQEKERFYSRLATIPGVRTLPSIGDWILIQVPSPADLARKVNRRLAPGLVSVPRHVPGTVRIHVSDPKSNELLYKTIRDVV